MGAVGPGQDHLTVTHRENVQHVAGWPIEPRMRSEIILPLYSGFPGFPLGFLVCFCPGGLMADLIEDSLSLKPSGPYPVLNHIR